MKVFQLNVLRIVAIICCASIGIAEVYGTPEKHTASDGREYLIETEHEYNWFEASNECARRDSQLVVIDSEEKNTAIIDLLKEVVGESRNIWLGGNDEFNSNSDKGRPFFWSATGKEFTLSFWANGNPDNYRNQEHCVHIWNTKPLYQWNDGKCSVKMGFICENNYYVDLNNKRLQSACDVLKKFNDDEFLKFERLQKDNVNDLNTRLQTLEQMAKEGKSETLKLQNINESSVQRLIDQQELIEKNLWEKVQKQGNKINEQIVQSITQINDNFDEKFNASISSPYSYRNVVVIKQ